MAINDSLTVGQIVATINGDDSIDPGCLVSFVALSMANGGEMDDEEQIQKAVEEICGANADWSATIDWIRQTVRFTKPYSTPQ